MHYTPRRYLDHLKPRGAGCDGAFQVHGLDQDALSPSHTGPEVDRWASWMYYFFVLGRPGLAEEHLPQ
jgi:hypothetical protein